MLYSHSSADRGSIFPSQELRKRNIFYNRCKFIGLACWSKRFDVHIGLYSKDMPENIENWGAVRIR